MNTEQYFAGAQTPENIKIRYRELAMMHHPDKGGDTRTMQEINAQYLTALERANGYKTTDDAGDVHTYRYNEDVEREIMHKIDELLRAQLDATEIALIGTWVWITGDTRPHKDALKEIGCSFHRKRLCWYWRPESYRSFKRENKCTSLSALAMKYGYQKFARDEGTVARTA